MARKPAKPPRGVYERDKGSGIWWIQYRDAAGKRRREKAGTMTNATNLLAVRKNQKLEGKLPVKAAKKTGVLFNDLVKDALTHAGSENDPVHVHELELKFNTLLPTFGKRIAETITRQELVAWLDQHERRRDWKPATYNIWKAAISLLFSVGIRNEKVVRNPMAGVRRKQANNGRCRCLSLDEEKALTALLQKNWPDYLPMFILSIHTGMRKSEQRRSVVGDYDPQTKLLTVHQKKDRNAPAIRHVPMTPMAIEAYQALSAGKEKGQPLMLNYHQDVMSDTRYWFDSMVQEAGIDDYHWHDNRHTACSRWVMTGVPLAAVAKYAGHSTIQMTMRYTHLIPDMHDQASEKMMSIYRSAGRATPATTGQTKVALNTQVQRATKRATGTQDKYQLAVNY